VVVTRTLSASHFRHSSAIVNFFRVSYLSVICDVYPKNRTLDKDENDGEGNVNIFIDVTESTVAGGITTRRATI